MAGGGTDTAVPASAAGASAINECVQRAVTAYFQELDGHAASDMYELVLSEVEPALLGVVLRQARGNLSRAAAMLGLNRATLRKKLRKYGLGK